MTAYCVHVKSALCVNDRDSRGERDPDQREKTC